MKNERSAVRIAVEAYLDSLPIRPSLPAQGVIFCPQCQGTLHFVLYTSNRLEVRCKNHCKYFGNF